MRDRIKGVLGVLTMALTGAVAVVETPMPAHAAAAGDGDVVVKLIADPDCSLGAIAARFPIEAVSTVLSTRRIHLVRWKDPLKWTTRGGNELAKRLKAEMCVAYAEHNREVQLTDERYHAWPTGLSVPSNEEEWRQQRSTRQLRLADAQTLSTGDGVRVAVLDTGTDPSHPALDGQVIPGWDYIDDDPDPFDEAGGAASGHGTFVAGVVHLVAPAARVISMRVLDAQGIGDGHVIAEAIYDAVQMGARVVNLSLGTADELESKVLTDMIKWARSMGTLTDRGRRQRRARDAALASRSIGGDQRCRPQRGQHQARVVLHERRLGRRRGTRHQADQPGAAERLRGPGPAPRWPHPSSRRSSRSSSLPIRGWIQHAPRSRYGRHAGT